MHGKQIAHRDIKLDNLLFDQSTGQLKIIDFGFALEVEKGKKITQNCGTPLYSDPDIRKKTAYCPFAADVWATGVTFYVLITGAWPFDGEFEGDLNRNITSGKFNSISASLFKSKQ